MREFLNSGRELIEGRPLTVLAPLALAQAPALNAALVALAVLLETATLAAAAALRVVSTLARDSLSGPRRASYLAQPVLLLLAVLHLRLERVRVLLKQSLDRRRALVAVRLVRTALAPAVLARQPRCEALTIQLQAPRLLTVAGHSPALRFELELLRTRRLAAQPFRVLSFSRRAQPLERFLLNELQLLVLVPARALLNIFWRIDRHFRLPSHVLDLFVAVEVDDRLLLNKGTTAPSAHS